MKKTILALALCLVSTACLFAQEISENFRAIRVATELADYGYATESAAALIEAADILSQVQLRPLEAKGIASGTDDGQKAQNPKGFTAEQLLADGKALAKNDKTLSKWAGEVQKSLKKGTRGGRHRLPGQLQSDSLYL